MDLANKEYTLKLSVAQFNMYSIHSMCKMSVPSLNISPSWLRSASESNKNILSFVWNA